MNLIERKVFNHDLHETYNMHDGVYNVKVLEKSLIALSKRLVTYVLISVLYTQLHCRQINVTTRAMCKKTLFNILGLVVQKSDNFTHWIEKFSNVVKIDKKFADLDLAITIKKV